MKKLLNKNSIALGVVATILSELLCALLLWLILLAIGLPIAEHVKWFAIALAPPALLLRYYAHEKESQLTLLALSTNIFVTEVLLMLLFLKYKYVTFQ